MSVDATQEEAQVMLRHSEYAEIIEDCTEVKITTNDTSVRLNIEKLYPGVTGKENGANWKWNHVLKTSNTLHKIAFFVKSLPRRTALFLASQAHGPM